METIRAILPYLALIFLSIVFTAWLCWYFNQLKERDQRMFEEFLEKRDR